MRAVINWFRWRWFCFQHQYCPKHRTPKSGNEHGWLCEQCNEGQIAHDRRRFEAARKEWEL